MASGDGYIRGYDAALGALVASLEAHACGVLGVVCDIAGGLVTSDAEGVVKHWLVAEL